MAELRLPSGHIALVDDEDFAAVLAVGPWFAYRPRHTWYVHHRLAGDRKQKLQKLHQFLTGWPMTDHINGDGLDNRRANLRPTNHKLNMANTRIYSSNTSGYRGVSFRRDLRKWVAHINIDGRKRHVGFFSSPEQAAIARDAAAIAAWGDFARLNFPIPN